MILILNVPVAISVSENDVCIVTNALLSFCYECTKEIVKSKLTVDSCICKYFNNFVFKTKLNIFVKYV